MSRCQRKGIIVWKVSKNERIVKKERARARARASVRIVLKRIE